MAKYLLEHEFDNEPSYIVKDEDPDADFITIAPGHGAEAQDLVDMLNGVKPHWTPDTVWDVHPDHPLEDWIYEVANNDTRSGYVDWVNAQIDAAMTSLSPGVIG